MSRSKNEKPHVLYVRRIMRLESFLCGGRRTKAECRFLLGYEYERAFSRDLEDLETLGSGVVRIATPGLESIYTCQPEKAFFKHVKHVQSGGKDA